MCWRGGSGSGGAAGAERGPARARAACKLRAVVSAPTGDDRYNERARPGGGGGGGSEVR